MAVIEGARGLKVWTGTYSFARDGGAVGTIVLNSEDGAIPTGSVVFGGFLDVTTAMLSGTGTAALTLQSAADLLAASAQAALTAGVKDIIPDATGSTAIKTTASRTPSVVIATAAFTAGAFSLTLFYK